VLDAVSLTQALVFNWLALAKFAHTKVRATLNLVALAWTAARYPVR
jgi:hypothetical protein